MVTSTLHSLGGHLCIIGIRLLIKALLDVQEIKLLYMHMH